MSEPEEKTELAPEDAALVFNQKGLDIIMPQDRDGDETVPMYAHAAVALFKYFGENPDRLVPILDAYFLAMEEFMQTQGDPDEDIQSETEEGDRGAGETTLD